MPNDLQNSRDNAVINAACPEFRRYHVFNDPLGNNIGQRSFVPLPHFDAHLAFALGNQEDHTTVCSRFTDLPLFPDLNSSFFNGHSAQIRHGQNRNLAAAALMKAIQNLIQRIFSLG